MLSQSQHCLDGCYQELMKSIGCSSITVLHGDPDRPCESCPEASDAAPLAHGKPEGGGLTGAVPEEVDHADAAMHRMASSRVGCCGMCCSTLQSRGLIGDSP